MVHEKLQWPAAPGQYPRNLVSRLDKFSSLSERVLDSVDHMVENVAFVSGFGCDARRHPAPRGHRPHGYR